MKKIIKYLLLLILPKNRFGDYLFALFQFIEANKRLPNKNYLNDKLFNIKTYAQMTQLYQTGSHVFKSRKGEYHNFL